MAASGTNPVNVCLERSQCSFGSLTQKCLTWGSTPHDGRVANPSSGLGLELRLGLGFGLYFSLPRHTNWHNIFDTGNAFSEVPGCPYRRQACTWTLLLWSIYFFIFFGKSLYVFFMTYGQRATCRYFLPNDNRTVNIKRNTECLLSTLNLRNLTYHHYLMSCISPSAPTWPRKGARLTADSTGTKASFHTDDRQEMSYKTTGGER